MMKILTSELIGALADAKCCFRVSAALVPIGMLCLLAYRLGQRGRAFLFGALFGLGGHLVVGGFSLYVTLHFMSRRSGASGLWRATSDLVRKGVTYSDIYGRNDLLVISAFCVAFGILVFCFLIWRSGRAGLKRSYWTKGSWLRTWLVIIPVLVALVLVNGISRGTEVFPAELELQSAGYMTEGYRSENRDLIDRMMKELDRMSDGQKIFICEDYDTHRWNSQSAREAEDCHSLVTVGAERPLRKAKWRRYSESGDWSSLQTYYFYPNGVTALVVDEKSSAHAVGTGEDDRFYGPNKLETKTYRLRDQKVVFTSERRLLLDGTILPPGLSSPGPSFDQFPALSETPFFRALE